MSPLKRRRDVIVDEPFAHEVVEPSSTLTTATSSNKAPIMDHHHTSITATAMRINTASDLLPVDMLNDEACFSPLNENDDSMSDHTHSFFQQGQEPTPEQENNEREIFNKARHYLNPGPVMRYAIYLFGERKLFTFFCVHFVCTMVIWAHFFLIKFDQQALAVPEGAPRFWWKRLVPPLEFGTMHAILFQMAIIPLTMTRYSIASLSESALNRFVPLNRMIRMHIHLGYTICILLVLSTLLFFAFFGLLCSDGDQTFCSKFRSEIMCTGYGIIASILILLGTSYFRHRIPYEVFYGVHHLVFIFYAITIAHTLDDKQRSGENQRSQTFKWFSATLVYYMCDRAAMYLNNRYTTRLVSSTTIEGSSNGSRMIILRLKRPALFSFRPGQFAYLRLSSIDQQWHPFSIASGPHSSYLEFYIEVFGEDSWTDKLWGVLEGDGNGGFSDKQIQMEVLGPCGTSLAKTNDFSHVLAIGTGTGIVPILSLYKQHVRQLLRLDPYKHFNDQERHRRKIMAAERALASKKGSLAQKAASSCAPLCQKRSIVQDTASIDDSSMTVSIKDKIQQHGQMMHWRDVRGSIRDMKSEAFFATRSIYGVVFLSLLTALGALLIGLTISWNATTINSREAMTTYLQIASVSFQIVFALIALSVWDGNNLFAYTDTALCLVAPFFDWYLSIQYANNLQGRLSPGDITTYCLLFGYMTARLWTRTVAPRHKSWRPNNNEGSDALEKLEIVWVSRSASLVSELMPDIACVWNALAEQWGKENASKVLKVAVYVTDKDQQACDLLKRELSSSELFQNGAIHFGRPDFATIIEDQTLQMICTKKKSYSLLAFCGSKDIAEEIHHHKVSNDMITAITGNKGHQMEFVSESYGGSKHEDAEEVTYLAESGKTPPEKSLTTRTVISYSSNSRKFLI